MRKIFPAICAGMFFFLLIGTPSVVDSGEQTGYGKKNREPLLLAMEETGVEEYIISINGWTKLPPDYHNDIHLNSLVRQVMQEFSIGENDIEIREEYSDRRRQVYGQGIGSGFTITAISQVISPKLPGKESSSQAGYLVVHIETTSHSAYTVQEWRQKIGSITNVFGSFPRITTCLVGWLDGKLVKEEWEERAKRSFSVAGGSITSRMDDTSFASFAGYAPGIPDTVEVDNHKVNMNVAIRYNAFENRTYVMIGSPVITREY